MGNYLAQQGIKLKAYHSYNGVFQSKQFKQDLKQNKQTIDFSGTIAHHQNGIAERAIRTVMEWVRTMMLHSDLHRPEQADLSLWPLEMDYTVHLWNNVPNREHRLIPNKIINGTLQPNFNSLKQAHIWGFPV